MRFLKIFFTLFLCLFIVVLFSIPVYAADSSSVQEDYTTNCRLFLAKLLDDGVLDSNSYYYVCWSPNPVESDSPYYCFFSDQPFYLISEDSFLYDIDNLEITSYFPNPSPNFSYPFGSVNGYSFNDGGSISYVVSDLNDYWVYHGVESGTFFDITSVLGYYSVPDSDGNLIWYHPEYFVSNFVPYLQIKDTNTKIDFSGHLAVNGEFQDTSFFQVSRMNHHLGSVLVKVLPAGISVLCSLVLVLLLVRFGKLLPQVFRI